MNSPKSANKFFLFYILYSIVLQFVFAFISYLAGLTDFQILCIQDIPMYIIPILIYIIISKRKIRDLIPLHKINFKNILYVIAITILTWPLLSLVSLLSSMFVSTSVNDNIGTYINDMSMFTCVMMLAVAPAVFEETLCRGVILSNYKTSSPIIMYIISGLFFGMMHMNFQQMSYAIVAGIMLAFLVHQTNSIFASMISHCFINGCQVILTKSMLNNGAYDISELSESNVTSSDIIYMAVAAIVFMPFLIFIIKKFIKYNKNNAQAYISSEDCTNKKFIDVYFILSVIIFILFASFIELSLKLSASL